jgi:hypothetical protein
MTETAIRSEIHETLDIHRDACAELSFYDKLTVNQLANIGDLRLRQVIGTGIRIDAQLA